MLIFKNNLKDKVKDELIRIRVVINIIAILIIKLIRLNNILFDREIEKKYRYRTGYLGSGGFF